MTFTFGPRRATFVDISEAMPPGGPLTAPEVDHLEAFDLLYRSLCALLFNYVPTSGHPGGSISSGSSSPTVICPNAAGIRDVRITPLRSWTGCRVCRTPVCKTLGLPIRPLIAPDDFSSLLQI